ncbi:MAG: transporter [Candidatus Raymondbacteria bacterium RifOxyA12_full_50_37]|uniref:Transporter n=1 Tax=Candidatus Raymondbacteria bacterium RIFOXYD12_FULL_49_13 TaxID=1817890 RepID=A0A1F7F8Q3_UNCRA|nr:MAG: transporter [Candidatus Raymondbacteria bacterium RifOxyA12_full_50_37]OGJ85414.1 MAG: transporter [Candidatus Raymondbacteria bacterium RIFOXYA2_FULL_49_16]OGJ86138.1 MAG: transporter [Candidatus Raymondbacteria bacterium RifOxyB12_full_50_8]OGJ94922.1 MAG: transporter [Candidatus Raymondbacteria bacterium RIFOXYC2_FULL_50_21]OGJ98680.1 MAG: transporter [Candidatus Raymondbacteria bacterium RifOxyC12_full_50_8]OGK03039.1 MAG: transporter [Candidatus Raymondbacteria bacterium RIFOXYD12
MENLLFSFKVVAPVFIIIYLGIFLKRRNFINENFIAVSSSMVFMIALPSLSFLEISRTDFTRSFNAHAILFAFFQTLCITGLAWGVSGLFGARGASRGAFVQGSFRSNYAIVGFALVVNLLGQHALAKAALLLAFVMPLYNVIAVILLTVTGNTEKKAGSGQILKGIFTNPLILSVIVALPFSYFKIPIPGTAAKTINYLASLTLPLALVGIGGSLNFTSLKARALAAAGATAIKLVVTPLIFTFAAYKMGFAGEDLAVLFLLFACPTAISSFIMAKAMESDAVLAADIVVFTTLFSVVTIALGVFILKSTGLI